MSGPNRRWEDRRFSDADCFLAYPRILEGRSCFEIAAELACSQKFLYFQLGRSKSATVRSPLRLSPADREEISRGLHAGVSLRALAVRLERSLSTIAREGNANDGRDKYRAVHLAARPRAPKLAGNASLRCAV